ncbi:RHS repeat-associated core domain-containing protein [Clostridium sp. 5N-1]|uniref:RHS repeat-associated core domain-containing protein n=1 Tax=Clostridium aquiflavi TaxID=3073603 RepID=A0ABU1EKQ9_9CLOT|nr:RHS repeat-associated core domain-containing protein [Clostridium sp. 5N-1]
MSRHYYSVDEQGSTDFITDDSENVKNEYYYDAFGNVIDSREEVHNRITYTGQQFDGITKQYYLRARFYNPVIGSFTQEDVYRGDGLNLYAYCGNNPVRYYDPSGYEMCPAGNNKQRNNNQNEWNKFQNENRGQYNSKQEMADAYNKLKANKNEVPANKPTIKKATEVGKPRKGDKYHTFHEFELKSDFHYASDSVQFRQANKSLIERLNNDVKFRKDMFKRNPELKSWLDSNSNLSNSPTGFTWHHSEKNGILELVNRGDHSTNFNIYHPTGKGGRDIWGGGKLGRKGKLDKNGKIKK